VRTGIVVSLELCVRVWKSVGAGSEDPHLVFLGEEFHAVENMHANVNGVLVHNWVF
jgi:hypothetical protein